MRAATLRLLGACALALALLTPPQRAAAQDETARLVADALYVEGAAKLIATGAVEIFYKGAHLTATRLVYDRRQDLLTIEGPLTLTDGGRTTILASSAEMRADLTEGVMQSARLIFDQHLQIAARELRRSEGRYTQLSRVFASSCKICDGDAAPLWELRARRVVHDQETRQLFFDRAVLRLGGLPVFFVPRLRVPDPSLDRAPGFLVPALRSTSALGFGVKLPYFLPLGPSRDVTLTPYVTTKGARALALRYRQAFRRGTLDLDGALAYDQLAPGRRYHLLGQGHFALPGRYELDLKIARVSDPAYPLDYGLGLADRLDSRLTLSRTRRNEFIAARVIGFQSLRPGESNRTIATRIGDALLERRFGGGPLGGQASLRFRTHAHARTSGSFLDSDDDGFADGRDLRRVSLSLGWQRSVTGPEGILGRVMAEATGDAYDVTEDGQFGGRQSRLSGAVAGELSWPWLATGADGAAYVLEPVVQVASSATSRARLANEDAALVEFDEGNLFTFTRFAGADAVETGTRFHSGLRWSRLTPFGTTTTALLGRIDRFDTVPGFGPASGLQGRQSDWLMALQYETPGGLLLTNRWLFDPAHTDMTKAESRLDWAGARLSLSSSYIHTVADPQENRAQATTELYISGRYALARNWAGKGQLRHDFVAGRATEAGLGLEFRNECLAVDLSLGRRFTSSSTLRPSTDFGFKLALLGFGGGGAAGKARQCR